MASPMCPGRKDEFNLLSGNAAAKRLRVIFNPEAVAG